MSQSGYSNYQEQVLLIAPSLSNIKNISREFISPAPTPKGGGGGQIETPWIFLALNYCSLTDYEKLWSNCSLFVNTSFDVN